VDGSNPRIRAANRRLSARPRSGGRLGSPQQIRTLAERLSETQVAQLALEREAQRLRAVADALFERQRLPLRGYGEQVGAVTGYSPDGWIAQRFTATLRGELKVRVIELKLWQPPERWQVQSLEVSVGTQRESLKLWPGQIGRLAIHHKIPAQRSFELQIQALHAWRAPDDGRELAAQLLGIWLWH
jgi:hypothetical protein